MYRIFGDKKFTMLIKILITVFVYNIFILSALSDNPEDGIIRLTLNRQKTPFEQHLNNAPHLKKYGMNFDWLYKKHHKNHSARTNDSIALYRYFDNEFYGTVLIGHPGQIVNVAFDTAWTLSWVLSSECHYIKSIGCLFHHSYNHKTSSGYKPDGRKMVVPEGSYNLTGYFSYDNISVAHSNVTNFSFVEMTDVPWTFLFSKIDGILGFGLQSDTYEPFFYKLNAQGKVKEPIFCIYLNRDKQSNHGGNIIMGFLDYKHVHSTKDENNSTVYDDILYMPINSGYLWQFDLDAIYIDGQKEGPLVLCKNVRCTALTDSSSNSILGPQEDIETINKAINAHPFYLNKFTVDCDTINKLPKINFGIGNKNFTLKGPDYTIKMAYMGITICLSAFEPSNYKNTWVLGGAFLSEYYTIYNIEKKEIGIVKAA